MLNSIETLPILVIPTILTSLDFSGYIGSVASILAVLYWVALTHKTVKKDHKGSYWKYLKWIFTANNK